MRYPSPAISPSESAPPYQRRPVASPPPAGTTKLAAQAGPCFISIHIHLSSILHSALHINKEASSAPIIIIISKALKHPPHYTHSLAASSYPKLPTKTNLARWPTPSNLVSRRICSIKVCLPPPPHPPPSPLLSLSPPLILSPPSSTLISLSFPFSPSDPYPPFLPTTRTNS